MKCGKFVWIFGFCVGFFSLDFLIHGANSCTGFSEWVPSTYCKFNFLYIKKRFCLFKFAYLVIGKISLQVEPVISSRITNPDLSPQTFLSLTKLMLSCDSFLLSRGKIFWGRKGREGGGGVCSHLTVFFSALWYTSPLLQEHLHRMRWYLSAST